MSEEFTEQTIMIYDQTKQLEIKDNDDYLYAGTLGKSLADLTKTIVAHYAPLKKAAHAAHKAITTQETADLKQPTEAKLLLKKAMMVFENAQEKIRLEAERVANEQLRKQEEERLAALPVEEGHGESSTPFEEFVPEVKIAPSFVATGHTRDNWKGEVVEFTTFVEACLKSGRMEFLSVNQPALNKYAASMKDNAKIDGVSFRNDKTKVL